MTLLLLFLLLDLIILSALIDSDKYVLGIIGIIATLIVGYWFLDISYSTVYKHPVDTLIIIVSYIITGIIYSYIRLYLYLKMLIKNNKNLNYINGYNETTKKLDVSVYKDRIICWMVFWPLSLVGYIISDIIFDFGNWIYNLLSSSYQIIADKIITKINESNNNERN